MIKISPPKGHSIFSGSHINGHASFNSKKLALPPIKWKNSSQDADALSNISKKITPQTDATYNLECLKRKSGLLCENKLRGILKTSFSGDLIKVMHVANLYDRKRVTFIDETMNKPIAQYENGDAIRIKKRTVCSCFIF